MTLEELILILTGHGLTSIAATTTAVVAAWIAADHL